MSAILTRRSPGRRGRGGYEKGAKLASFSAATASAIPASAVVAARDALRPYDDGGMDITTDAQSDAFVAAEDARLTVLANATAKTPGEAAMKLDAVFIRMERSAAWHYLSREEDTLLRSCLRDLRAMNGGAA